LSVEVLGEPVAGVFDQRCDVHLRHGGVSGGTIIGIHRALQLLVRLRELRPRNPKDSLIPFPSCPVSLQ
jgi:hypothetical protein